MHRRNIKMDFEKKYDVAVIGGGIAGVAAALASARAGKKNGTAGKNRAVGRPGDYRTGLYLSAAL